MLDWAATRSFIPDFLLARLAARPFTSAAGRSRCADQRLDLARAAIVTAELCEDRTQRATLLAEPLAVLGALGHERMRTRAAALL